MQLVKLYDGLSHCQVSLLQIIKIPPLVVHGSHVEELHIQLISSTSLLNATISHRSGHLSLGQTRYNALYYDQ